MSPVVSDKMQYSLKPITVELKAHTLTIHYIHTNTYKGDTSTNFVFRIQHILSGQYIDTQATHIKCTLKFTFLEDIDNYNTLFATQ